MKNRILKTLEAYLLTNQDVLEEERIKDLKEQIEAVKSYRTGTWSEQLFKDLGRPRGLAIMILDLFEDMLDEKGIVVPDDDRTGTDGEACLYGCTYGDLEEGITYLLSKYINER